VPATDLGSVLGVWKNGIDAHQPGEIARLFTEDAIFQGLKPYTVGREGVAAYYDSQPLGMTVDFRIIKRKAVGTTEIGWIEADFHFLDDRPPVEVNLTVVLIDGLITHYHVSRRV
jgi:hypothetical protein